MYRIIEHKIKHQFGDCEYPIKEMGYSILMSKDGKTEKTLSIEI